ncbi:sperm flagellar protein 1-like [Thrips palmi]|uniref:Sperm flagellar protein 1-like n=1 Tax=Thrips palmi TaxID=161013 RepID=A0A6P9AC80_THRPL|nr:sperm flagellar protein 1-like [Thrips palmi]
MSGNGRAKVPHAATCEALASWLDQVPFSKARKNIPRDFADGVMMAELLKHYYPKLVELHNYTSASCLIHKVNNWLTLNRKVLSKIGIKLSKDQIEQIASASPDYITPVLISLKQKIDSAKEKRDAEHKRTHTNNPQNILCFVEKKQADAVYGIPMACEAANGQQLMVSMENMVPQRLLDEKLSEIAEKDDAINILIQKVSHLDTLLQLKDQRIKDLTQQLQSLQVINKELGNSGFM